MDLIAFAFSASSQPRKVHRRAQRCVRSLQGRVFRERSGRSTQEHRDCAREISPEGEFVGAHLSQDRLIQNLPSGSSARGHCYRCSCLLCPHVPRFFCVQCKSPDRAIPRRTTSRDRNEALVTWSRRIILAHILLRNPNTLREGSPLSRPFISWTCMNLRPQSGNMETLGRARSSVATASPSQAALGICVEVFIPLRRPTLSALPLRTALPLLHVSLG